VGPRQEATAGLAPVLQEGTDEVANRGAVDAQVGLPPVLGVLGVARPHVGDPHAAHEPDSAVHHQDAPMHAVVELPHGVPAQGPEDGDMHARTLQAFQVFAVQLGRAVAVEDHVDLDPGSGTFDEGLAEAVGGGSRPIDIGGQVNGLDGRGDGVEHGLEGGAVVHDLDLVSEAKRCAGHGRQQPGVLCRAGRRRPRQVESPPGPSLVLGHLVAEENDRCEPRTEPKTADAR